MRTNEQGPRAYNRLVVGRPGYQGELRPTARRRPVLAPVAFGAWAIETPTAVPSERHSWLTVSLAWMSRSARNAFAAGVSSARLQMTCSTRVGASVTWMMVTPVSCGA